MAPGRLLAQRNSVYLISSAAGSNPGFSQLAQTAGGSLIMPCLMERQSTAVTNALTNPTAAGARASSHY